ncbi:uncharacterized protein TNCV_323731 [Trichonephila clavipes]|nr:uncharacterized protein TNCV_323731 [Trichonephila clavipes]
MEVVFPHLSPIRHHGKEKARVGKGHRVTSVILVKKLDNCSPSDLESIFRQIREHYPRSYQLQCEHYGVDKITLVAKACLFEIFFRLLATWRCVQRGKEFCERKKK